MLQTLREAAPPAPAPRCPASPGRRQSAPRLRALFLRHFRDCGDARQAAKRAGVARSTVYRWRERDARFRARWETYDEMRRHEAEDHLVHLMREGEKTTAFYKGEQVGWKVSFTVRPAVALLASQDRREKLRLREREWEAKRASVSHSEGRVPAESRAASKTWVKQPPRKTARRDDDRVPTPPPADSSRGRPAVEAAKVAKPVPVSHSEGRVQAEKRAASSAWSKQAPRKPSPPARVPHRLQDDWGLPKATGFFQQNGFFSSPFRVGLSHMTKTPVIPSGAARRAA